MGNLTALSRQVCVMLNVVETEFRERRGSQTGVWEQEGGKEQKSGDLCATPAFEAAFRPQLTIRRRAHYAVNRRRFYPQNDGTEGDGTTTLLRAGLMSAGVKSPSGPMHIRTLAGRA